MHWHRYFIFLLILITVVPLAAVILFVRLRGGDMAPGWQVRCLTCGLTFDAGDLGIIRLHAVGNTYLLRKCGQCEHMRRLIVERKPADLPACAGPRCDLATHTEHTRAAL
jgi:hypothetical protein